MWYLRIYLPDDGAVNASAACCLTVGIQSTNGGGLLTKERTEPISNK